MNRRNPQSPRVTLQTRGRQSAASMRVVGTMAPKSKQDVEGKNHHPRVSAPVRRAFFLVGEGTGSSPLSRLIRSSHRAGGGRNGGRTRLALVLTLLWVCARPSEETQLYETTRTSGQLADLIGFEYTGTSKGEAKAGTEAINHALRDLEERGFVQITPGSSTRPRRVTLLCEDGTGDRYVRPRGGKEDSYVQIPQRLWTQGALADLNAPGMAMLLVSLDLTRSPDQHIAMREELVKLRYGISNATRRRGLAELKEQGFLELHQTKDRDSDGKLRLKNSYVLNPPTLWGHYRSASAAKTGS